MSTVKYLACRAEWVSEPPFKPNVDNRVRSWMAGRFPEYSHGEYYPIEGCFENPWLAESRSERMQCDRQDLKTLSTYSKLVLRSLPPMIWPGF